MRDLIALSLCCLGLSACQSSFPQMARPAVMAQSVRPQAVAKITVQEAHSWLADPNAQWKLLDLRTAQEITQDGRIQGSDMLDFYSSDFQARLEKMDRNQPYIIYCRSGNRSGQALEKMRSLGFRNVYDIQGGILAWKAAGLPLVR